MSKLFLITGPAGVGKSTISKNIAENLKKSALIEGDDIYNMVIGGHISPWKNGNTLDIMWDICIYAIRKHLSAGFDVVFNYIIGNDRLDILKEKFADVDIVFAVLMADEETILKRDAERSIDCQMGARAIQLLEQFKEAKYQEQLILDTTNLSINKIVKIIQKEEKFIIQRGLL